MLEDATAALKAEGMPLPDGIKINVMENSPSVFNFVLPENPKGELSDADLELVAGGAGFMVQFSVMTPFLPILPRSLFEGFTSPASSFSGFSTNFSTPVARLGPYSTSI